MDTIEDVDSGEGFDSFEAWLASRPAAVQALAKEFPIGTQLSEPGSMAWLIGYTEDDELILSCVNPYIDWNLAVAERFYCDARALRAAIAKDCRHARTH